MNNIIKCSIFLLVFNFIYSVGPRSDRQTFTLELIDEFPTSYQHHDEIIGWWTEDGKWKNSRGTVDKGLEGRSYYLSSIKCYRIKEYQGLVLLLINEEHLYYITYEEFKKIKFKDDQFHQIHVGYLHFESNGYMYFYEDKYLESNVAAFFKNNDALIDYLGNTMDGVGANKSEKDYTTYFVINYYQYDNVIQYLFSHKVCKKCKNKLLTTSSWDFWSLNIHDIDDLGAAYFESDFNKFKDFFSLSNW